MLIKRGASGIENISISLYLKPWSIRPRKKMHKNNADENEALFAEAEAIFANPDAILEKYATHSPELVAA